MPRFTLATLLLLTALVASLISQVRTSWHLARTQSELAVLRNDLAVLDAPDDRKIYAIALPTYGHLQWRWRIQLPVDGEYQLRYAFDQIPESGYPAHAKSIGAVFCYPDGEPLERGATFRFDLAIYKDAQGEWLFKTATGQMRPSCPITNPPAWLNSGSFYFQSEVFGTDETVAADADDGLMLLRYRKPKMFPNGSTVKETNPTDGLLIWIERIESP